MTPVGQRNVDWGFEAARAYLTSPTLATSFDADVITATEPSATGETNGIYDLTRFHSGGVARYVQIWPFGDANNATFSVRLVGWKKRKSVWLPYTLFEADCTCGNFAGVSGNADLAATEFMADTISQVTGNANVDNQIISPTNDTPGHALIDLKGCMKLKYSLKKGTCTVANLLHSFL